MCVSMFTGKYVGLLPCVPWFIAAEMLSFCCAVKAHLPGRQMDSKSTREVLNNFYPKLCKSVKDSEVDVIMERILL